MRFRILKISLSTRLLVIGTSALAVFAAVLGGFSGAHAENNTDVTPSEQEINDSVEAGELGAEIKNLPNINLVGIRLNQQASQLEVWVDDPSSLNVKLLRKQPKLLELRVLKSKMKKSSLDTAILNLNRLVLSKEIKDGVVVSKTGVAVDGSGVEVSLDVSSQPATNQWIHDLEQTLGVPVLLNPMRTQISLASSRTSDASPWRGGSLFRRISGSGSISYCSQGFGVVSQSTSIQYMLTARHCFESGVNASLYSPSTNTFMGSWSPSPYYSSEPNDASLTFPDQGLVRNSVYYGSPNSATAIQVQGASANVVGTLVCTDGANSGMHCNVRVISGPSNIILNNTLYTNVVTGVRDNNYIAGALGDSGGPVISNPSNSTAVYGYGIIHALDILGNCADYSTPVNLSPSGCGATVYWIDLGSALSSLHMDLK